ncbi:hypothetical protein [Sinorhizobium medicae]
MNIVLDRKTLQYLRRIQGALALDEKRRAEKRQRKSKPKSLLAGDARKHVVNQVMDVLRGWRASPFEYEASTRAGLRVGLIMRGHGWEAAHCEAHALVQEGLRLLGAKRPTWEQGQREYTIAEEDCNWCGLPLPEGSRSDGRRRRFCSALCAQSAFTHRDYGRRKQYDAIAESALSIIRQSKMPMRDCQHCGVKYRPLATKPDQQYCSEKCKWQAMRVHPDRSCLHCSRAFQPKEAEQKYCSRDCYTAANSKPRFMQECAECGKDFWPRKAGALRCSFVCRNAYIVRTRKPHGKSNVIYLTPDLLDREFAQPGVQICTAEIFDRMFG